MLKYECDSRKVEKGQIFVALKGLTVDGHDYIDKAITKLLEYNMLNKDALIICEYNKEINHEYDLLEEAKTKKYGDKFVTIFKKI